MSHRKKSEVRAPRKLDKLTRAELMTEVRRLRRELTARPTGADRKAWLQTATDLEGFRKRYADLYDLAPVGYLTLDANGCIRDTNLTGAEMLGGSRASLIGRPLLTHIVARDRRKFLSHLARLRRGQARASTELAITAKDHDELVVEIISVADRRGRGRASGSRFRTIFVDLTDRRQVEQVLRESEQHLRRVIDSLFAFVGVLTPEGVSTHVSRSVLEVAGLEPKDVLGKPLDEIYCWNWSPEVQARLREAIRKAAGGESSRYDEVVRFKDGEFRTVDFMLAPMRNEQGRITHLIPSGIDITERRRAEKEIRESEWRQRTAMRLGRSFAFEWHPATDQVIRSQECGEILGLSGEEVVRDSGQDFFQRVHPEDRESFVGTLKSLAPDRDTYTTVYRLVRPDGQIVTLEETGRGFFDTQGRLTRVIGMTADVTERKLVEEALRRSNTRLEILSETAARLLEAEDPQQIVNSLCEQVMDFLDCQAFFNFLVIEGEDRLHLNAYAGIPEETARQIEWLEFGTAVCGCAARDACRIVAENIGETPDAHTEMVRSFGIRAYACHPLLSQNKVIGTLSFGTRTRPRFTEEELEVMKAVADQVSIALERKWALTALKRTAVELARSNEDLDQFASVASHDLQEPLRTVGGFVQLLQKECQGKLDARADEYITFVVEGVARMQALIHDLLAYARVSTRGATPGLVRADDALKHALDSIAVAIGESDAVITQDEMPVVCADVGQLSQVFQNLIGNAIKFHRPGQRPDIHVGAVRQPDGWLFSVRDNGIGIAEKDFDRVFQIFQRLHTRDKYSGTGMGLAIWRRIIDRHGGRIWLESEPEKGSTFFFTIPDKLPTDSR